MKKERVDIFHPFTEENLLFQSSPYPLFCPLATLFPLQDRPLNRQFLQKPIARRAKIWYYDKWHFSQT
ncbi:MAG: hypothetical protein MUP04_01640 [Anaerolineae bacterium]|nr:hypothetical protein [Anaerolineae bacterium]